MEANLTRYINISIFLVVLFGCQEDYYPPGFYGSDIERLLSGTEGTKIWLMTDLQINGNNQSIEDCLDSVKIVFATVESDILTYDLRYRSGCQEYDSIYYGILTASTALGDAENPNLFTDSLLFEGGQIDYLILQSINPGEVRWRKRDSVISVFRFAAQ